MQTPPHLPDHAYIPGTNQRHSDDAFDTIRETAQPGMSANALAQCNAFQTGLFYIKEGYFWEAHEVLEPVWMALPEDSEERRFVQGLIQLANGMLKMHMNRPKAAHRLSTIARDLIMGRDSESIMGINRAKYVELATQLERQSRSAL